MRVRLVIAVILMLALVIDSRADSPSQRLTIFAATSLTDAFEALSQAFQEAYPAVDFLLNFSSSSTLAAQLLQGAPADIFASANELQMQLVIDEDLIAADTVEIFAHNQLVVITPADNPAQIEAVADLADEGVLLVLAAQATPIRAYTDAMLASYNDELGAEFFDAVMRNLVSEESNVRQVVARVALGEADAGIVYQSDAIGDVAEELRLIEIDPAHNQLASYPIAPLAGSTNQALAARFIDFALSQEAQALLAQYGFCSPVILGEMPPAEATPEPTPEAENAATTPHAACPAPAILER